MHHWLQSILCTDAANATSQKISHSTTAVTNQNELSLYLNSLDLMYKTTAELKIGLRKYTQCIKVWTTSVTFADIEGYALN